MAQTKHEALVTVTHKEYQALLRRQRVIPVVDLSIREKRELERVRREMAAGDVVTLNQLEHELVGKRRRQRA